MASRRSPLDLLVDALAVLAAAQLCALVVLVVVDVAARYLRVFSLPWSLEAAEYMLYAITFLGAPWVLREQGHIAIELAVEHLAPGPRRVARRIADALSGLVCLLLVVFSAVVTWRSWQSGVMVQKSFVFPEWWVYAGMAPVLLVMVALYARRLFRPRGA